MCVHTMDMCANHLIVVADMGNGPPRTTDRVGGYR